MGYTEFSCYISRSGKPIAGLDTQEGRDIKQMIETAVLEAGAERIYWGHSMQNPAQQWFFLDWNAAEKSIGRQTTPEDLVLHNNMSEHLITNAPLIRHVFTKPWPPTILAEAPIVGFLSLVFHANLDDAEKRAIDELFEEFKTRALDGAPGLKGVAHGWSLQRQVPPWNQREGKGDLLMAFIGWTGIQAHDRFTRSSAFGENITLLRSMKGLVKMNMFHIACQSLESSDKQ